MRDPQPMKNFLLLGAFALILVGCQPSDDYVEPERKVVSFEGATDDRLVGAWKTADGKGEYNFKADGSFALMSKVTTPSGAIDSKSNGQWKVKDGQLLIKDQNGNVVPYKLTVAEKSVTLALTGSLKNEVKLNRK
ncbi:Domain of unknown function DUF5640 [Fimbriimonadaceae bacterium]